MADCATDESSQSYISYLSRPVQKLMTGSTQKEKVSSRSVGKSLRAGLDLHGIMREMNYTCGRAARHYRDFNPASDDYAANEWRRYEIETATVVIRRMGMRGERRGSPLRGKGNLEIYIYIVPLTQWNRFTDDIISNFTSFFVMLIIYTRRVRSNDSSRALS